MSLDVEKNPITKSKLRAVGIRMIKENSKATVNPEEITVDEDGEYIVTAQPQIARTSGPIKAVVVVVRQKDLQEDDTVEAKWLKLWR